MPLEQHQEKVYPKDAQSIYQAGLKATEKLGGKIIVSAPEKVRFEARLPKVIAARQTAAHHTAGATTPEWVVLAAQWRCILKPA